MDTEKQIAHREFYSKCLILFVVFAIMAELVLRYGTKLVECLRGVLVDWSENRNGKENRQIQAINAQLTKNQTME